MGLEGVGNVILVLSGKGGVGKSSIAAQVALTLFHSGHRVGVLDVDLCGPSIPRMFNAVSAKVSATRDGWSPVAVREGLSLMSIGFLLPNPDDAVVWRGPKKTAMIRQFLHQVDWSVLDYLVVDTPPGTSDEHLSLIECLRDHAAKTAFIVTTPQLVALSDVEREVLFCREVGIPIAGVVENMSGYTCPSCRHDTNIFSSGGGEALCEKYALPFLGRVPIDPLLAAMLEDPCVDIVTAYRDAAQFGLFRGIVDRALGETEQRRR